MTDNHHPPGTPADPEVPRKLKHRSFTAGQLQALRPKKHGRNKDEHATEMVALRRENDRLRTQLAQAELIITAQKKLSQALEALTMTDNESSQCKPFKNYQP